MLCIEFVNLLYKISVIEKSKGVIKNIQPRDTDITGHKTQNKTKQNQSKRENYTNLKSLSTQRIKPLYFRLNSMSWRRTGTQM